MATPSMIGTQQTDSTMEPVAPVAPPATFATPDELDYDRAYRAHQHISYSPDVRAKQEQEQFAAHVNQVYAELLPLATNDALCALLLEEMNRYTFGYLQRLYAVLDAKSRTASSMITGPSNFPTAHNRKRLDAESKRINELLEWCPKAKAKIRQRLQQAAPLDEQIEREWQPYQRKIESNLATIAAIDAGDAHYTRSAFVNSIAGMVQRLAQNGRVDLVERALAQVAAYNASHKKPAISKRHTFWTLADQARTVAAASAVVANTEPTTIATFDGGQIIDNPEADRVQILFDGKPGEPIRTALKRAGWNWSPSNSAWQRKRTPAAEYSAKQICGLA